MAGAPKIETSAPAWLIFNPATHLDALSTLAACSELVSWAAQNSPLVCVPLQVYGSDQIRARALRSMKDGKLRTSAGDLLPYNGDVGQDSVGLALNNAPDASSEYFAAGDVRANENILLTAFHVLWLREHNKVATELSEAFPDFGDELLFDIARSIVIAEYQSIVYNEWLPRLLGPDQLPAADYAYNTSLDPSISAFFSTAAFRFGHSMVNKFLWVTKKSGGGGRGGKKNTERVPLKEAFFNPKRFREAGLDGLLLGAAWHHAPELDVKIVDDIRNFLFIEETDNGTPEKDLAAFNIQRGRDMGLPTYNDARESFSLPRLGKSDFLSITKDKVVARSLAQLYGGDVDNVDAFIGGLAETPVHGSILGPLFFSAIKDQFQRLRYVLPMKLVQNRTIYACLFTTKYNSNNLCTSKFSCIAVSIIRDKSQYSLVVASSFLQMCTPLPCAETSQDRTVSMYPFTSKPCKGGDIDRFCTNSTGTHCTDTWKDSSSSRTYEAM